MRLDKFISKKLLCGSKKARQLIASGQVNVHGQQTRDNRCDVNHLTSVMCEGVLLSSNNPHYIMLHKPQGYVSATVDDQHPTVVDLLDESFADQLHIAGRLDKESTGLLILSNDGSWSRCLTEPVMAIPKRYLVTTEKALDLEMRAVFKSGFYFAYEDITTLPAELEIVSPYAAIVTIYEGKYHQIKRIFHAVGNRALSLHRLSIGCLELDSALALGEYRSLTHEEVRAAKSLCLDREAQAGEV